MQLPGGRRVSPALVVAMIALFVALCGSAGAVVTATVPLAKRALVADRAKVANTAKTAKTAKVANRAKTAASAATADLAQNALTLTGQTRDQFVATAVSAGVAQSLVASPPGARPASTAAGLVSVKVNAGATLLPSEERYFIATCDPGQRPLGGGFSSDDSILALGSHPDGDAQSWGVFLVNLDDIGPASATVYVTCLK
jgi:hypothetical protein